MARSKGDYALLWANGMTFGEVYDLMKADLRAEWEADFAPTSTEHVTIVPAEVWVEITDDEVLSWAGEDGAEPVNAG